MYSLNFFWLQILFCEFLSHMHQIDVKLPPTESPWRRELWKYSKLDNFFYLHKISIFLFFCAPMCLLSKKSSLYLSIFSFNSHFLQQCNIFNSIFLFNTCNYFSLQKAKFLSRCAAVKEEPLTIQSRESQVRISSFFPHRLFCFLN